MLTADDAGLYPFGAPGVLQYYPAFLLSWSQSHSRVQGCLKNEYPLDKGGKNRREQSVEVLLHNKSITHEAIRCAIYVTCPLPTPALTNVTRRSKNFVQQMFSLRHDSDSNSIFGTDGNETR